MQTHFTKGLVRGKVFPSADCDHRAVLLLSDGTFVRCSLLGAKTKKAVTVGVEQVWKVFALSHKGRLDLKLTGLCVHPHEGEVDRIFVRGKVLQSKNGLSQIRIWSQQAALCVNNM